MTTAQRLTLPLFILTLFLSAAIMFAVQPMIGKMLLPLVGGTPSGWVVAMFFFQVMLLIGYQFAHLLSRFAPAKHALIYLAALLAASFFLPLSLDRYAHVVGDTPDAGGVFLLLLMSVGAPFVALSATSSTIQRLFTATGHTSADDPYFLYAASNLGSFAGLLFYPVLIETTMGVKMQTQSWFYGYILLIALGVVCLAVTGKAAIKDAPRKQIKKSTVTRKEKWRWTALAFFPSSLMLGVTMHISTDVFSAPMVWVVPLALYLLTFVIAFSKKPIIRYAWVDHAHPWAVILCLALICGSFAQAFVVSWVAVALHLLIFTVTALACHMQLAQRRPLESNESALTEFYLMMSLGGALGGLLNAFIIPAVLDRAGEYPVVLILSLIMAPAFAEKIKGKEWRALAIAIVCGAISIYARRFPEQVIPVIHFDNRILSNGLLAVALVVMSNNLRVLLTAGLCLFLFFQASLYKDNSMFRRNFYGILRVTDEKIVIDKKIETLRKLSNGTTVHGTQVMGDKYEKIPTAYYWEKGPVGEIFNIYKPKDIAVVGLGAGTLNCYAKPDSAFTFIEINKDDVELAEKGFTFLSACKGREAPEIVIGDGRLEIEKMEGRFFDLIVLDGFTGDAIPLHLLTREAMAAYESRLSPRGVILFNISNRYFNLIPILTRTAQEAGLEVRLKGVESVPADEPYASLSIWMAVGRRDNTLATLDDHKWFQVKMKENIRPWTDDYTNLLSTLFVYDQFKGWLKTDETAKP